MMTLIETIKSSTQSLDILTSLNLLDIIIPGVFNVHNVHPCTVHRQSKK